jgi:hypothetical protein
VQQGKEGALRGLELLTLFFFCFIKWMIGRGTQSLTQLSTTLPLSHTPAHLALGILEAFLVFWYTSLLHTLPMHPLPRPVTSHFPGDPWFPSVVFRHHDLNIRVLTVSFISRALIEQPG